MALAGLELLDELPEEQPAKAVTATAPDATFTSFCGIITVPKVASRSQVLTRCVVFCETGR